MYIGLGVCTLQYFQPQNKWNGLEAGMREFRNGTWLWWFGFRTVQNFAIAPAASKNDTPFKIS